MTDVEFLLDGLGVESLSELQRLVGIGRTFEDNLRCPDCVALWGINDDVCPGCGLTIETIAERLSRR